MVGQVIGRIRTKADFAHLRRAGQTAKSGGLRIRHASPAASGAEPAVRVAYAISRSVGNAVVRNRLRRQLRGVLERLLCQSDVLRPGDYLVTVTPAAVGSQSTELEMHVKAAVEELSARSDASTRGSRP